MYVNTHSINRLSQTAVLGLFLFSGCFSFAKTCLVTPHEVGSPTALALGGSGLTHAPAHQPSESLPYLPWSRSLTHFTVTKLPHLEALPV